MHSAPLNLGRGQRSHGPAQRRQSPRNGTAPRRLAVPLLRAARNEPSLAPRQKSITENVRDALWPLRVSSARGMRVRARLRARDEPQRMLCVRGVRQLLRDCQARRLGAVEELVRRENMDGKIAKRFTWTRAPKGGADMERRAIVPRDGSPDIMLHI